MSTPLLADVDSRRPRAGESSLPPRQERLLLRARSRKREVPLRRAHRSRHQLGLRPRSRDRPAQRESRHGARSQADRRSGRSFRASRAGSTGSPWPTTRTSARFTSCPTSGRWGLKFWAEGKFEPPAKGEWYLGADYQNYLTSDHPGNFVAFDVVERKVLWRAVSPAPFWAGAVATSTGLVFTGDMRGYFMAIDARSGTILWQFQTGSGIIGSPITYELDGKQYLAVPSGGIGGDMSFYYKEPKAGNLWVFALDGGGPAQVPTGTNLTTLEGGLPKVGEPGHTLGGRVLPGYGFPATEGGVPIQGDNTPRSRPPRRYRALPPETRRSSPEASGSTALAASAATSPAAARAVRTSSGRRSLESGSSRASRTASRDAHALLRVAPVEGADPGNLRLRGLSRPPGVTLRPQPLSPSSSDVSRRCRRR